MFITQVIIYNLATEQTIDSFRYIISELWTSNLGDVETELWAIFSKQFR